MRPRHVALLMALAALFAAALPAGASARYYNPSEVVVSYTDGTTQAQQAAVRRGAGAERVLSTLHGDQRLQLARGRSVDSAVAELEADPQVRWAHPTYIARKSMEPNDPAYPRQWHLHGGAYGINMPSAWDAAADRGAPAGKGTVVAVVDSGVAYQNYRRFKRAPDLKRFTKGYDFVDRDRHPNDEDGHGTHVASTIAEGTDNGISAAGIAYRAKIMPVRVLDAFGNSVDTLAIAKGIRYAASHGADVINLSFEFEFPRGRPVRVPEIGSALRYARSKGALIVGAAGNGHGRNVAFPARAKRVLSVGATTIRGCQAEYSNSGPQLDMVAPGGGYDANLKSTPYDRAVCKTGEADTPIFQQTLAYPSISRFSLPADYEGTSMAAPQVAAVAAMMIAEVRRQGGKPTPEGIEKRLERTAREAGKPGWDRRYGHGLLDAAAALSLPRTKRGF